LFSLLFKKSAIKVIALSPGNCQFLDSLQSPASGFSFHHKKTFPLSSRSPWGAGGGYNKKILPLSKSKQKGQKKNSFPRRSHSKTGAAGKEFLSLLRLPRTIKANGVQEA